MTLIATLSTRSYLQPSLATQVNTDILFNSVMSNEYILFQWSMFGGDLDNDDGKELLEMIIKHYIKIRGFSFASTCVELYKIKNITKRKGATRKELFTSIVI